MLCYPLPLLEFFFLLHYSLNLNASQILKFLKADIGRKSLMLATMYLHVGVSAVYMYIQKSYILKF